MTTERTLEMADTPADPQVLFDRWFGEARARAIAQPEAVTLATVDDEGRPDARTVLMRGADQAGFRFYTNYDGGKARALAANPHAAMLFHWEPLARQVRIRGSVERLSAAESDAYFAGRPRLSQLGAWASPQSEVIDDRDVLEARVAECTARFAGVDVPRPPHWGGYLLRPTSIEFWQGRAGRLHDRIRYRRDGDQWLRERLAP